MKKKEMSRMAAAAAGAGVMIVLAGGLVMSSGPLYKWIEGRELPVSDTPVYHAGTYEGSARGYGGPVTVKATFTEYGIDDVKISAPDETPEIGKAVAVALSKEIWRKQSHSVDSVSGATMTSNAVKKAMAECVREAALEGTELAAIIQREIDQENAEKALPELPELLKDVEDGSYSWQDSQEDGNGFYNRIDVTVENGRITELVWDAVDAEGTGKRKLSAEGQYDMTESGPKWHEQADALAQYVIEHQSTSDLLNESGTSDAVASVSIHAGGFVDCLKKCLLAAKGDVSHVSLESLLQKTPDGTYSYRSGQADENGFFDTIEMTVEDHQITALTWDAVGSDESGKRKLSAEGNYDMTEDGPKWYEQSDALSQYLLEHQSEAGLLDETGYASDAVASVSIYSGGFLDAVKRCLVQASQG